MEVHVGHILQWKSMGWGRGRKERRERWMDKEESER